MAERVGASVGAGKFRRSYAISFQVDGKLPGESKGLQPKAARYVAAGELKKKYPGIPENHQQSMMFAKIAAAETDGKTPSHVITVGYDDRAVYEQVLQCMPQEDVLPEQPLRVVTGVLHSIAIQHRESKNLRERLLQHAKLPLTAYLEVKPVTDRDSNTFLGTVTYATTAEHLADIVLSNPSHLFSTTSPVIYASSIPVRSACKFAQIRRIAPTNHPVLLAPNQEYSWIPATATSRRSWRNTPARYATRKLNTGTSDALSS